MDREKKCAGFGRPLRDDRMTFPFHRMKESHAADEAAAQKNADEQIAEKVEKGYTEMK
jgi:predicted DNA-binding WGR domain protein